MASFTPSQQSANQPQGDNSNNLADPTATASSTNALASGYIDPSSLSNKTVDARSNNNYLQAALPNQNNFPLHPYNSPFVYSIPYQPNTSYTQQITAQQAYPASQFTHSYMHQAPVQQAHLPNYYYQLPAYTYSSNSPLNPTGQAFPLQYQTYYNPSPVTHPQTSLRATAAPPKQPEQQRTQAQHLAPQTFLRTTVASPQQPEQQRTQAQRLAPQTVPPRVGMSNENNPTMQGEHSSSLGTPEQQIAAYAMQKQPTTPARNTDRYSSEEVSPRTKPSTASKIEYDEEELLAAAEAHIARLTQNVPQTQDVPQAQGKSPPKLRSSTDSTIPPLSLADPGQSAAAVANAPTTQITHQFIDLTRREPSNAAPQEHQEPETLRQLCESLDSSAFYAHNPPVISGDQQELPVDFPDYLRTNHRAAETVAGLLSQSSKTLDIPLRSKAVRDALNTALADPSMVVLSEVLTSVGTIKAARTNQDSSAPPTGICPRSVFGMDGPHINLVAPGRSATVRPGASANTYPREGAYTPLDYLSSPPIVAVSRQTSSAGLLSPPARPTAGITPLPPHLTTNSASFSPASTTALMSPPHYPAAANAGNPPEQARLAYMPNNISPPEQARVSYMPNNVSPPEQARLTYMPNNVSPPEQARLAYMPNNLAPLEPLVQFHPQGSYSARTGSSQSFASAISRPPESLRLLAHRNAQARKRKREAALRGVTPPQSPHMVGEVGFPSVVAASYANEGESSKRLRPETPLEPFPNFGDIHQANASRPRQQVFPGYAGDRQAAPPVTTYTNIHQTQAISPPYMINQQTHEASPPYMINQQTQTAAPAYTINQQTQASIPKPDTLPTHVDAQMLAAIGPYASLF